MKIVILNGSPKGLTSVTMQYMGFIYKKFSQHNLVILNISQEMSALESDRRKFQNVIDTIKTADAVLWAFPVYEMVVPAYYKRFIELIEEQNAVAAFRGKHAAIFSTSIKFFDHTAHNYMHAVCDDFGMNVYGTYSAQMYDLFDERERTRLLAFFAGFCESITRNESFVRKFPSLDKRSREYMPGGNLKVIDPGELKVVIVHDNDGGQANLKKMTERIQKQFSGKAEIINLRDVDIKGGCLGCLHCTYDNTCIYKDKDGFMEFYRTRLKTANILIFAGAIQDRYLSSVWKRFFDRAFFDNHIPSFPGKQMAFLVSGPLQQIPNLRQIIEAYSEMHFANLVGIATDEPAGGEVDRAIEEMARRAVEFARQGYIKPGTFIQVGGRKIFRDETWGRLRFPFIANHRYFKTHDMYDFPQSKDYLMRLKHQIISFFCKIPLFREEIYCKRLKHNIALDFKKVFEKI